MWQRVNRRWHLFVIDVSRIPDGQFAATACSNPIQVRRRNQSVFPSEKRCNFCSRVSQLINSSIDNARYFLPKEKDLAVLRRALELTQSSTLVKMLDARIRRLEGKS